MDSFEKLRNVEASIRAYLGHIRNLEVAYAIAKGEEIAMGISPRRPFLKSRAILQQLKMTLRKARETQKRYNSTCTVQFRIMLLEKLVLDGDVFVQAKVQLSLINKNAEQQNTAYRTRLKKLQEQSYEEGPTAMSMTKYVDNPEIQKLVKIAKAEYKSPVQQAADDIMSMLTPATPKDKEIEDEA